MLNCKVYNLAQEFSVLNSDCDTEVLSMSFLCAINAKVMFKDVKDKPC